MKRGDKIYFCQIAFDKETEADALAVTTADKTDLKAGCAGFGWTELIEVVEEGIDKDDEKIVAWATGYKDYTVGANVNENWKTPEKALGKALHAEKRTAQIKSNVKKSFFINSSTNKKL